MAPPPAPELKDDVLGEILLRLPPGDPACLVRASLVCTTWRRLLSDGAFLHQYRAFHRTPPVLGFFQDQYQKGIGSIPQYVATIQKSPVRQPPIAGASLFVGCNIADSRHGRVLFQEGNQPTLAFTVWDPITDSQKCISPPVHPYSYNSDFMAAVLCAVDGCDHLGCSMGPFLVLTMGIYYGGVYGSVAWTCIYSSKTGEWSASTSVAVESSLYINVPLPSLIAGGAIYFILEDSERILKYSLVEDVISVMTVPPQPEDDPNMIFAAAQDGELGAPTLEGYSLDLWLWRTDDCDGIGEWERCRVIELAVMIPISISDPSTVSHLAGFAQGAGTIFVFANDDIFTVELKSGQVTKIGKRSSYNPIFPFMSFYTPVIWLPFYPGRNMILYTVEDGGLGVACMEGCSSLRLLNCQTDADGVLRWTPGRVIKLSMTPSGVGGASTGFRVVGCAEGTGYIFCLGE